MPWSGVPLYNVQQIIDCEVYGLTIFKDPQSGTVTFSGHIEAQSTRSWAIPAERPVRNIQKLEMIRKMLELVTRYLLLVTS